ncbi:hypothetical protein S144_26 [Shewanella sp. phage 1/44]|uniref:hypothetical protein n=1 Tax=Shewanella sp. phage 1/44 TaxID=1458862 RepID=UPI0004F8A26D|nr:hypothetical protein S144_26 [Shewanella sp. phage 1/44]AHK11740.1 hypothetical protein S144_26 [Shewanella sp. phage 1/44]
MLNISSILKFVLNELKTDTGRIVKIDEQHFLDTATGVEYHLYDDVFKMTHDDVEVAKTDCFTHDEQAIVWEMKKLITDPEIAAQRKSEYPKLIKSKREGFSKLYENPMPTVNTNPMVEVDATEYVG